MKELYERYIEIYDDAEDLIEDLKDGFTKDEMKEIFQSLELEFDTSHNKDQISKRMADKGFYERVKDELKDDEIDIKLLDDADVDEVTKEKLFLTLETLQKMFLEESELIQSFWKNLKKEADKSIGEIRDASKKHIEEIQETWDIKTDKFQEDIEELAEGDIPEEDLEDLEEGWEELVIKINTRLEQIRDEIKRKKGDIKEIIYEYIADSQRIMEDDDKDMRDLYPLWFDMIKDVREELEQSREALEEKEEGLLKTWNDLSDKVQIEVMKLAEEHEEEAGELVKIWTSMAEDIDKRMEELPKKYRDIYGKFWKEFGMKKGIPVKDRIMKISQEYSDLFQDPLKSLKETYSKYFEPKEKDEIDELKERIAKLEKKLEEKD